MRDYVVHVPTMRWCSNKVYLKVTRAGEPYLDWVKIENESIIENVSLCAMLEDDTMFEVGDTQYRNRIVQEDELYEIDNEWIYHYVKVINHEGDI